MRRSTGFLVGGFYLIVFIFGIVCLATSQFRASSGSAYDTWRLNYESNDLLKTKLKGQLDILQKDVTAKLKDAMWYEYCLALFDSSGKLKPAVETRFSKEQLAALIYRSKEAEQSGGEAWCIFEGLAALKVDKVGSDKEIKDVNESITYVRKLWDANEAEAVDLVKGHQEFMALRHLEKNSKYLKWLIKVPYDLLVMLLVTSMGLLGGIIRILRDYHTAESGNLPAKDYFLVPLIGGVAAIGGYILAKTGLLLLSSTRSEASLSPFMVGLVGMVSGLMAKEVIDRIAAFGREMLKTKNGG